MLHLHGDVFYTTDKWLPSHVGGTPAVDRGMAEWTHGSHGPHDAAWSLGGVEMLFQTRDHLTEYVVFPEAAEW